MNNKKNNRHFSFFLQALFVMQMPLTVHVMGQTQPGKEMQRDKPGPQEITQGQDRIIQGLDSLFQAVSHDTAMHFNGVVLAADHGKILYRNAKGFADIDRQFPNTDTTRYSLASLSKVFTCVAVMQLKDKGKLRLDDPFVKFFPDFPWPAITIRQMLSHTSGLPDFFEVFGPYAGPGSDKHITNRDLIPALKKWGKLVAPPGTRWSYSSTAIGLLALLVEKLSGLTFPQYLSTDVFEPADMEHSYVKTPYDQITDEGRAVNYVNPGPGSPELQSADSARTDFANPFQTIIGPGLVVSSAQDLLRFDLALYGDKLLTPASRDEMFSPVKLSDGHFARAGGEPVYGGMDWMIDIDTSAGKVVMHNGGSPGISTILLRNLRTHQTVILLENTDNMAVFNFGINAMNLLNNKPLMRFAPMPGPPHGPGPRPMPGPPPGSQPGAHGAPNPPPSAGPMPVHPSSP